MPARDSKRLSGSTGICGASEKERAMVTMSRISAVSFASFVLALGAGCGPTSSAAKQKAAYDGTMAESTDGKFVYTANLDTGTVTVLDADQRAVVATVQVGSRPTRIAVGPDDTLYVTDRGSRAVSIIHRGNWTEAGRITVNAEPIGVAVSNDGSTLYVVSNTSATLDAYDLTSSGNPNKWEAQLGDEPRNVAVLPDGRLYVTH
jgi:YVTN family beta-propeller protein